MRLGYEGELEVAQRLNELMRDGNRIYNDMPAGKFNIDQEVIGVTLVI